MDEVCEKKTNNKKSISNGWKQKKPWGAIFFFARMHRWTLI